MLEANGSATAMLRLEVVLYVSRSAIDKVISMLSPSSSKRFAAITDSNFRDCKDEYNPEKIFKLKERINNSGW